MSTTNQFGENLLLKLSLLTVQVTSHWEFSLGLWIGYAISQSTRARRSRLASSRTKRYEIDFVDAVILAIARTVIKGIDSFRTKYWHHMESDAMCLRWRDSVDVRWCDHCPLSTIFGYAGGYRPRLSSLLWEKRSMAENVAVLHSHPTHPRNRKTHAHLTTPRNRKTENSFSVHHLSILHRILSFALLGPLLCLCFYQKGNVLTVLFPIAISKRWTVDRKPSFVPQRTTAAYECKHRTPILWHRTRQNDRPSSLTSSSLIAPGRYRY